MFNPMVISNSLGKIVGRVHTTLRNSLIQGIHTYYSKHGKFYQVIYGEDVRLNHHSIFVGVEICNPSPKKSC